MPNNLCHAFDLYHAIMWAMYLVSIMLLFVPCIWFLSCYYVGHVFGLYHAIICAMHLVSQIHDTNNNMIETKYMAQIKA
jgi:hypothetical protein